MLKNYPIEDFLVSVTPIPQVLGVAPSGLDGFGFDAIITRADGFPIIGDDVSFDVRNCISPCGPYASADFALEGGLEWAKRCIPVLQGARSA
ncbi:hypothetical protein WM40_17145 [Robbsia andropogonis]|uniref:Uncharacterized protein n=1 Tax=Robbsia andropogonis TaxID=28092 RepID=A0A0F5JZ00_9BURK|nr:hypothetical protein [Robbsia andropogonis]KKB62517.1 hypothetical protein WM40_17145 [Robbsia andropogonis]MCP1116970.1 hypothetical protein [Robbsia andropogonis]MCP1126351.1 hypothetical protein [Robbsia andropogonis]